VTDTNRQTRRKDVKQKCHKTHMEPRTRSNGMCGNLSYCLVTAQVVMTTQEIVLTVRVGEGGTEGTCWLQVILSCQEIISVFYCKYKLNVKYLLH